MKPPKIKRLILYPHDISTITGLKIQAARRMWHKVRKALEKQQHQFLTVREFCEYMDIEEEEVMEFLQ
jgi:hypothetical protein